MGPSGRGGSRGGGSGAPSGVRPRVPAMVKREVADSREADEDGAEDTTRLQYRGFDKSKLNASRKQQRKEARVSKKQHKAEHQRERSAANDKLRKLEEENQRLKRMLEQQPGHPGGLDKKRKAAAEPERPAKKPEAAEPPAKKAKDKDPGRKAPKGIGKDDSNFMKMIREQGLDKDAPASQGKGKGGSSSKSQMQTALEQDLREIEDLKAKLGGNWRDELAQDGWLDLFDSMDNLGQNSGEEDHLGDSNEEHDSA
jgi:hypothetical protein